MDRASMNSTLVVDHRVRRVADVMVVVVASLAVASAVHLFGHVHGRSSSYNATAAGIAEAVIGVVLVYGAVTMLRSPGRGRTVGLASVGFAIAGFLLGIGITATSGRWPDIAYHATVLPVLIVSEIVLLQASARGEK
jgi:cytochrome bd-type quinol oxidase subunit 2